ncbi:MAG: AraC family transcriptional regulator [Dorea sp.]|jgi:AraC-like DNA-binding protein|nr:AraC family transcriptional regulator [Dorea sp.]
MSLLDIRTPYVEITAFYALNLPEYSMHPHRHPRCEIMYVTKGSCQIYVNEQEFCLKEQQFVFLKADVLHRLSIPKGRPCSILNLEFSCLNSKTDISLSGLLAESPSFAGFADCPGKYFTGDDTDHLGYSLKDLINQLRNCVPCKHDVRSLSEIYTPDQKCLIRLLFLRMMLELSKCVQSHSKNTGMLYLRRAQDYIASHLTEEIRVPALAECAGINKSYLQSLFSRYMDCTITDYINRKRLEHSVFLLINSSLSVTDVAFQSGYNSRQHFGSTFEKYYGISPRAYRQLHGKNMDPSTGEDYYYVGEDGVWANIPMKLPELSSRAV